MKGSRSKITVSMISIAAALLCVLFSCKSNEDAVHTDGGRPADYAVGGLGVVVYGVRLSGIPGNFYVIDTLMLPLNAICDALGYVVELIENGAAFTVSDGTRGTKAAVGENQYARISDAWQSGDVQTFRLNSAPQLVDGDIFVPAEFFVQVLGESYLIEEGTVTFK